MIKFKTIVLNFNFRFFFEWKRKIFILFSVYRELWTIFMINSEYRINFFSASNRSFAKKLSRNLIESESCDKKFFLAKHFLTGKKKTWRMWRVHCTNSTRLNIFMHHRKNGDSFLHSNISLNLKIFKIFKIFQKFTRYERNNFFCDILAKELKS